MADNESQSQLLGRIRAIIGKHGIVCVGEFVGTTLFLFFGLAGAHVANAFPHSEPARLLYISLAFGLSLAVNVWIFYRISGGMFNPAVTLGLVLVGAVPISRGSLVFVMQMLGGIVASALVACLPGQLDVPTALSASTSVGQGLFLEALLTFELVFTIFMLAVEKHRATFIAPVGIGLALFVAELTGVQYTGGSLNPARSFGPNVIAMSFESYHWIYWLGPALGSVAAAGFYKFLLALEYRKANPNQDADSLEDAEEGNIRL